ncbi:MAG: FAD-dependent oxidoreductase [Actinomycetota bacterium]
MFDVLIVGRGLFGSAAARHVAESGASVVAVGPAVGSTVAAGRQRVYSSHDDEARLTRPHDRDERWAPHTARAVADYAALAEASGIDFHEPVGYLMASRPGGDGLSPDPVEYVRDHGIAEAVWEPGDRRWQERWPRIDFPTTHAVAFQPGPAGYIRPKRLIEAQETLTTRSGGELIDDTVIDLRQRDSGFAATTAGGRTIEADRVIVATGAFANMLPLLPEPAGVTVKTEIFILGEVSESDARELGEYPTVKHLIDPGDLDDIYMTPPVRFPDGRYCIKMGANTTLDTWPTALDGVQRWFESETDPEYLPILGPPLQALWPDVEFLSMRTRPCIVTYTPDGFPLIDEVQPGLVVATAGNGAGAKGADVWGAMAADLVVG